jgi:hypothetical protein
MRVAVGGRRDSSGGAWRHGGGGGLGAEEAELVALEKTSSGEIRGGRVSWIYRCLFFEKS